MLKFLLRRPRYVNYFPIAEERLVRVVKNRGKTRRGMARPSNIYAGKVVR